MSVFFCVFVTLIDDRISRCLRFHSDGFSRHLLFICVTHWVIVCWLWLLQFNNAIVIESNFQYEFKPIINTYIMFEFRTKYNCIRFLADSDGGDLVIENKSKAHWMCLCMHELAESEWMRRGCRNKCVYINFSFAFFSFPYYRLPHLGNVFSLIMIHT